jgi:hypothetical protein
MLAPPLAARRRVIVIAMTLDLERRSQSRFQPRKPLLVDFPDQQARVRNLNLWGAYIEDPRPLPGGHVYKLRLWVDQRNPVAAKAMVRRSDPGKGMAVEFVEMTDDDRERLQEFINLCDEAESLEPI